MYPVLKFDLREILHLLDLDREIVLLWLSIDNDNLHARYIVNFYNKLFIVRKNNG